LIATAGPGLSRCGSPDDDLQRIALLGEVAFLAVGDPLPSEKTVSVRPTNSSG
jgi:hypothetical protein